jgi:hypothetical protein
VQVVSASGQYLAVGAASGSTLVFQLPVSQAAGSQGSGSGPQNPTHSLGSGHSPLPGGAAMWQLGGHSGAERGALGLDPVSSLGFSVVGAAGDALWLAVGHVSGSVTVWELQKRGPRQIAGIGEADSAACSHWVIKTATTLTCAVLRQSCCSTVLHARHWDQSHCKHHWLFIHVFIGIVTGRSCVDSAACCLAVWIHSPAQQPSDIHHLHAGEGHQPAAVRRRAVSGGGTPTDHCLSCCPLISHQLRL